jgi:hypothetical protein
MRHLPKHGKLREVFGDDAAESVQNVFAVFGGHGQPQLTGFERTLSPDRARGGTGAVRG